MRLDDWQARVRVRTSIGSSVGGHSPKYRRNPTSTELQDPGPEQRPFAATTDLKVEEKARSDTSHNSGFNQPKSQQTVFREQGPETMTVDPDNSSDPFIHQEYKVQHSKMVAAKRLSVTCASIRRKTTDTLTRENVQSEVKSHR